MLHPEGPRPMSALEHNGPWLVVDKHYDRFSPLGRGATYKGIEVCLSKKKLRYTCSKTTSSTFVPHYESKPGCDSFVDRRFETCC